MCLPGMKKDFILIIYGYYGFVVARNCFGAVKAIKENKKEKWGFPSSCAITWKWGVSSPKTR